MDKSANKQKDALIMNDITMISKEYQLYIFQLLFTILRPMRLKYDLSINCILTLNACYLYGKLVKDRFYLTDIYKFSRYYSIPKTRQYFNVLALRGFINPVDPGKYRVLYYITPLAVELINEIEESYNKELYSFSEKYNIEL